MTRCKILRRWILFCITLLLLAMPAGCASAPGNPSAVTLTPEQIQMFQYLAQNMTVTDGKVIFAVELEAPSFNAATE